jgi:hypothetical protein
LVVLLRKRTFTHRRDRTVPLARVVWRLPIINTNRRPGRVNRTLACTSVLALGGAAVAVLALSPASAQAATVPVDHIATQSFSSAGVVDRDRGDGYGDRGYGGGYGHRNGGGYGGGYGYGGGGYDRGYGGGYGGGYGRDRGDDGLLGGLLGGLLDGGRGDRGDRGLLGGLLGGIL